MDRPTAAGLKFDVLFSRDLPTAPQMAEWPAREAAIKDSDGKVVFRQQVQAPPSWSDQAVNVVASKYFYGDASKGDDPRSGGRESSVAQLVGRVARTIAGWGVEDGYFDEAGGATYLRELTALLLGQYGSFNSPVWFNVGLFQFYGIKGAANGWVWDDAQGEAVRCEDAYERPQGSACFILSVEDDMGSILERAKTEGMLFKYGSGVGSDNSTIRSIKERLSSGGRPSGPVSFMRIYDAVAGQIKSGGSVRRAAKMETLKDSHPDIIEFIGAKAHEDRKARALVAAGYSGGMNGEAAATVAFQNANLSVRATDDFMRRAIAAESGNRSWSTKSVMTGETVEILDASAILDAIAEGTWACGDPGMQFDDTIQFWHTCPNESPIHSSNPCSEYLFINDSACNLASLNLTKFRRPDGTFEADRFAAACRIFIIAQEILVGRSNYPTEAICRNSHDFRPLGLGYAGLGALLMEAGLPYDSDEGRSYAGAITALMHGAANLASAEIAGLKGPFDGFADNREPMLHVMERHRKYCVDNASRTSAAFPERHDIITVWAAAKDAWRDAVDLGCRDGFRNAQATVLAPTGTIAFMMGLGHSTGMEPSIGLVQYKTLSGGGMLKIPSPSVGPALDQLGYDVETMDSILGHVESTGSVEGSALRDEHLSVFDCAFPSIAGGRSIHYEGHIKMMAALQPFLSGAISKTVNMPAAATVADIRAAYVMAWELDVKAVAIYRDGSKESQPVSAASPASPASPAGPGGEISAGNINEFSAGVLEASRSLSSLLQDAAAAPVPAPRRERLPDTRESATHKLSVGGVEAYLTVGQYPDGRPGEVFVTMAKEGSTLGGLMDAWATAVSLILQYGVPLPVIVAKFSGGRFEPAGSTRNADIPFASSLIDYAVRWIDGRYGLAVRARPGEPQAPGGVGLVVAASPPAPSSHGPLCPDCGSMTVPTGRCWTCSTCGTSVGGCG